MDLQELVGELITKLESELDMVVGMNGSMPNIAYRAAGKSTVMAIKAYIYDRFDDISELDIQDLVVQAYDYQLALSGWWEITNWFSGVDSILQREQDLAGRELALNGRLDSSSADLLLSQIISAMILTQSARLRQQCREDKNALSFVFSKDYEEILKYFDQLDALET